jgi:hypothetical protein
VIPFLSSVALGWQVWPEIRMFCVRREVQFEVVDMRWGIRDESTDDQMTVKICTDEIKNCQVGAK